MKKAFAVVLGLTLVGMAFADAKGDEIARKYYSLKKADDTKSTAVMTLIDKSGAKKTRKLEIFYREGPEGKDAFMNFLEPADVAGTKFLTISHKGAEAEQRLYLPALKKARKIAATGKSGEFVNSDFYFYDLEDKYFEDHTHTFVADNVTIPDQAFAGMKFSKIEMNPVDTASPYSKEIAYVNAADNFVYKLECYDAKDGALLKTFLFVKVQNVKGVLLPVQTIVTNHKKGTKTLLALTDPQVNTGVKADVFSPNSLGQ
jgi:outer membrane lipoprotein-sorting protein